ncbi:HpcH/HpaI aldolase/citrate lyase family protein [Pseudonocardia sp. MH-G8]|uniref:HpcH/HpaI aldolase family protein n=1 Tax=Pseudonocardia sp. MH-G8 TaxID=1854588 RepID=UPI000BA00A2B|nr:aldolase/citrate lyase family protein [Pseudonocardia sp. MH-G8]OZM80170.1 2-dehydro-3-deoxyglucarate aldolase [Pseudonocardia sp. MH-G8]
MTHETITGGPAAPLRSRLRDGERAAGGLVRMPSEELVEMLAVAGLDFVLVDCEHGPADVTALRHHIALADAHGLPVLVRIGEGEGEHNLAQRALDQGAQGIVAPHVESAADATELVRALHYPPRGARGFATYPRAGRFGTVPAAEHRAAAAASTLVIAMLESPAAIRAAGEIVAVDGIDGYMVGVADLGACLAPGDPGVEQLLAAVRRDPATAGTIRADLATSAETAAASFADGAQLVVHNVTHVLMAALRTLQA